MITVDRLYFGDDYEKIERINFLQVVKYIKLAKDLSDPLLFVSSSKVFDRSVDQLYDEDTKPNPTDICGKFISESEKRVLDYEHGYVYRIQDSISDHIEDFKALAREQDPSFSSKESMCPIDFDLSIPNADANSWLIGQHKITHICSPYQFDMTAMWAVLGDGGTCRLDEEPFSFRGHVGHLFSKYYSNDRDKYEDFAEWNKKKAIKKLSSLKD
jgi:hypothetical protein